MAESLVPEEFRVLQEHLQRITDTRLARGKVHPLVGLLSLTVLGLMAGGRSLSDIHRYRQAHPDILEPLTLRRSPSVPTLSRLLRQVSVAELRTALAQFACELAALRQERTPFEVVAADGKRLRGAWEQGRQAHVLHLFAHHAALALDQVPAQRGNGKLGELGATSRWVEQVADTFPGLRILTGDALLTERSVCATIIATERDYVLRLKKTKRPSTPRSSASSPRPDPQPTHASTKGMDA